MRSTRLTLTDQPAICSRVVIRRKAEAAEGTRQGDDRRGQGVLVWAQLGSVPLRRALLAKSAAGAALGDMQPLTDCWHAAAPS